jgi:2-dehydropantoate 2-reductase
MLCFVCLNRQDDGSVDHLGHGQVGIGALTPGHGGDVAALADLCRRAGVEHVVYPSLTEARWRKLVWNIPFNGLCTAHDCTTDVILADPALTTAAAGLMAETVAAANADLAARGDDARIGQDWIDEQFRRTREMGPYAPSTLLDARAGRPLEIDAMFHEPLRRARAHGVAVPLLEALARRLG